MAQQALECSLDNIQEWLPPEILQDLHLPPLREALAFVHFPPPGADIEKLVAGRHPTQARLAFEELLAHHLSLRRRRAQWVGGPLLYRLRLARRGSFLLSLLAALHFARSIGRHVVVICRAGRWHWSKRSL
jgi:RecG-like helicase